MKIFLVNRHHLQDVLGGSEIQCYQLQQEWQSQGHETLYIALDGHGHSGHAEDQGIKTCRLTPKLSWQTFSALENLLKKEKPDVVYLRSFNQLHLGAKACKRAKVLCIYNTCNITDLMAWRPFPLEFSLSFLKNLRGTLNRFLNYQTLFRIPIITINKEHMEFINQKKGRAHCIYNSMIDRHSNPISPKEKTIYWISNIKTRKRPEIFLELVERCANKDWKFHMVGDLQNNKQDYLKKIKTLEGKNPQFKWLGPKSVTEVDALLASGSILVNTCEPEGFGNNFIQAWLAQCPTVSLEFDADGIMEREKIGFCPGNNEAFFEKTKKLMEDNALRMDMGKRAREWALNNHNLKKNAERYLNHFFNLLNQ